MGLQRREAIAPPSLMDSVKTATKIGGSAVLYLAWEGFTKFLKPLSKKPSPKTSS